MRHGVGKKQERKDVERRVEMKQKWWKEGKGGENKERQEVRMGRNQTQGGGMEGGGMKGGIQVEKGWRGWKQAAKTNG